MINIENLITRPAAKLLCLVFWLQEELTSIEPISSVVTEGDRVEGKTCQVKWKKGKKTFPDNKADLEVAQVEVCNQIEKLKSPTEAPSLRKPCSDMEKSSTSSTAQTKRSKKAKQGDKAKVEACKTMCRNILQRIDSNGKQNSIHPSSETSSPIHPSNKTTTSIHPLSETSSPKHPSNKTTTSIHPLSETSSPIKHPSDKTTTSIHSSVGTITSKDNPSDKTTTCKPSSFKTSFSTHFSDESTAFIHSPNETSNEILSSNEDIAFIHPPNETTVSIHPSDTSYIYPTNRTTNQDNTCTFPTQPAYIHESRSTLPTDLLKTCPGPSHSELVNHITQAHNTLQTNRGYPPTFENICNTDPFQGYSTMSSGPGFSFVDTRNNHLATPQPRYAYGYSSNTEGNHSYTQIMMDKTGHEELVKENERLKMENAEMKRKLDNIKTLSGTRRAISIACGADHSVALLDNGEVYTWGYNGDGQLGLDNNDEQSIPCKVEALSGEVITQIVCGFGHTLVLSQQGSIYSWGWNGQGQLGTGDETDYNHPKQILINERFTEIAAGHYYDGPMFISAGLTDTGRVYMWGGGKHTSPYLTEYTIIDEVFANIPDTPFTWRLCSVEGGALKPKHMRTVSSCETQTDIDSICFKEFEKLRVQLDGIEKEKGISIKDRESLRKENETLSRKHELLSDENRVLSQEKEILLKQIKILRREIELIRTNQAQLSEKSKIDENNFAKTSTYSSKTQEEGGEENDLLTKEIDGLKHQIHQLDNEGKALRKEMESMKTNMARLTDENSPSQIDTSGESISGSQYHSIRFGELHRKVHQFGRQLELFKDEFDQVTDGETLNQNNLSKQASFEVKKQAGKDCTKWDEQYKELNLKPHDFTKENKRLNLTEQTDPIKDLVEDLSKAFDDSTTGDIKFNTPDGVIFCHKAILQIRCAYLKSRFEAGLEEETKDTIEVPYTYSIYRAFLYFLYTGTISLELKDCIGLLALSNTYGEDGLKRQCENILKRGIAVENSAQLYSAALDSDAKELEDHCFNFIVDHMPDVVETEEFSHLNKTTKAIMMKVHQKATSK